MNISSEIFPTDETSSYCFSCFFNSTGGFRSTSAADIMTILLGLPINSYVIWLIVKGAGNGLTAEFFSLNLAVCEIFVCVESVLSLLTYTCNIFWITVLFLGGFAINGRPMFQCLICVERYLAVVHPVIFLKFKPLRYRVICSVIVWLAGFFSGVVGIMTFLLFLFKLYFVLYFGQFLLFLSIQLFCCLAVLRALKQPGPGDRGRKRVEENHIKRRAFYLILISTVLMVTIYTPYIALTVLNRISVQTDTYLSFYYICFTLAGLVQPLFFLYRVGKLNFIK